MITLDQWNRPTAEVLAAMFTENTGRHFLDSGGAYGRAWERNQGKVVEDFVAAPSTTIDWKYECYSINMFQWLLANLTYDPIMQRRYELVTMGSEDPHLYDAEVFAAKMHDGHKSECRSFNSYNGESLLDGVIQGVLFNRGGDQYIALQIHGGCDVRGGYTAPRMFQMNDADYWWDETIEFFCQNDECKWGHDGYPWAADLNLTEWIDRDGSFVRDPWEDSQYNKEEGQCPNCGQPLSTEARLSH